MSEARRRILHNLDRIEDRLRDAPEGLHEPGEPATPEALAASGLDPDLALLWGAYDGLELGPEFLDRSADAIRTALDGVPVSAIVGSLKLLDPDPGVRAGAIALDRQRLLLAHALGAAGLIEVPAFGPCRFPDIAATPSPHRLEDDLLIEGIHARWTAVYRGMSPADFECSFVHPELGAQLTLDWHLQNYAWHSHHHLAHVTELRRAKGW